jgi:kinesin family protein C1
MNEHSSRSHMVFRLRLRGVNHAMHQQVAGCLSLVDLAGSERIKRSNTAGDRMAESIAINKSLSALGNVLLALSKKEKHVPYRDSKLTWILQPCFAAQGRALIVVNLSSALPDSAETLCTLRFASTASTVELGKAKRNVQAITTNVGVGRRMSAAPAAPAATSPRGPAAPKQRSASSAVTN